MSEAILRTVLERMLSEFDAELSVARYSLIRIANDQSLLPFDMRQMAKAALNGKHDRHCDFFIKALGERVHVRVQSGKNVNPQEALDAAIRALQAERNDLEGCSYHQAAAPKAASEDGATGGGEVPTGVPSQVPSSASHDDDEHGGIVTMAYMMGAKDERDRHAKATTPGGDLLEQAAFKRMHDWLRYEASAQEVGPVNDLHIDGDTWDHVFAPALKAAGDGGEA